MKKFNAIAPVLVIMAILVFGTTAANAGILVSDATGSETQTCQTTDDKIDWGIIIRDIVGIIIRDFTGFPETPTQTNCGIIIRD